MAELGDNELRDEFIMESLQSLREIEQDLLSLEEVENPDDLINGIFRAIHSMKGSSGYLGYQNILRLAHLGETLLDELRKHTIPVGPEVIDALLSTIDMLLVMVESEDLGANHPIQSQAEMLEGLLETHRAAQPATAAAPVDPGMAVPEEAFPTFLAEERDGIRNLILEVGNLYLVALRAENLRQPAFAEGVTSVLESVGAILYASTAEKDLLHVRERPAFFLLQTVLEHAMLVEAFGLHPSQIRLADPLSLKPLPTKPPPPVRGPAGGETPTAQATAPTGTVREGRRMEPTMPPEEPQRLQDPSAPTTPPTPPSAEAAALAEPIPAGTIGAGTDGQSESGASPGAESATPVDRSIGDAMRAAVSATADAVGAAPAAATGSATAAPGPAARATTGAHLGTGNGAGEGGEAAKTGKRTPPGGENGGMIKIPARFLDELLRFTGNMVMARNQLLTRYEFQDDSAFATLSQAITEVHRGVVQTRMETVGSMFDRFRRVVRDLSKQLGKRADLRTQGGELELDRAILEAFMDPMTHMIRNCVDHAIEPPDERQAAGKSPTGTIWLRAYQESGEIIIEVEDDGRGIAPERIAAKAVERGLVAAEQAEALSDYDKVQYIFAPGFSTAETVSDVSGRGVGMDVVRTNIEKIGGLVDCQTRPGQGTTFQARLPLTKAMVSSSLIAALIIRLDGQRFAIPQSAVNELIRVSPADREERIRFIQDQEVYQLRELVLPIVHLGDALGHEHAARDAEQEAAHARRRAQTLIVLQHRQQLFGVMVDEIIGIEEVVVRDLPTLVEQANVFTGHTVLGDGQVIMIVDIPGVVDRLEMRFMERATPSGATPLALSVGRRSDRQTMIIFNYAPEEFFAIPLELVSLVEKIPASTIKRVGDRFFYPFKTRTIPLLFLDKHLPVTPIDRDLSHFNLILPARMKYPIGILTGQSLTVTEVSERFDANITHEKGILGTFMHEDRLVMLLDLYALFEHDDPDHFDTAAERQDVPARILLVEDSLFYRRLGMKYLAAQGREIDLANDGEEALGKIRANPEAYDLIVSDIEMPKMDGFELIQAIRSDPTIKHLPVIALTALQDDGSREKGLRLGFDEYVVKVDKDSLAHAVNRHAAARLRAPATTG